MSKFDTMRLPADRTIVAPDGSDVRVLLGVRAGGMAQFELQAGKTARAVVHKTVEEVWFVVSGRGEMWRKLGTQEEIVALEPGTCLTIPVGTHFQFRAASGQALAAIAVSMPPWPGDGEALPVAGPWQAT